MTKHAEIIKKEFPDKNIIWSTHCHNDLGLALENSMNAVFDGPARQVEDCINGVGERAGNVSLEQCVMFINLFGKQKDCHYYNDINIAHFIKPFLILLAKECYQDNLITRLLG